MIFDFINNAGIFDSGLEKILLNDKKTILKYSGKNILHEEMILFYKAKIEKNKFIIYRCFFCFSFVDFSLEIKKYEYNFKSDKSSTYRIFYEREEYRFRRLEEQIIRFLNENKIEDPELADDLKAIMVDYMNILRKINDEI